MHNSMHICIAHEAKDVASAYFRSQHEWYLTSLQDADAIPTPTLCGSDFEVASIRDQDRALPDHLQVRRIDPDHSSDAIVQVLAEI